MSAFLVICPPQVSETAESLIACVLGWPSAPLGWNLSNSASRSLAVSSLVSVSERICTVADAPLPTMTTDSASLPSASWNTVFDLLGGGAAGGHRHLGAALEVDAEGEPADERCCAIAISRIAPLIANHSLRRPMTSKAPVPV